MPQPPKNEYRRMPSRLAMLAAVAAGLVVTGWWIASRAEGQVQIFQNRSSDEKELASGVYLPTDRALSRAMARARERLAENEYHQALTFLQEVLARDEDTFLERAGSAAEQQGLKATARQVIGDLPPEGRKAYELLNGAAARKRLESALAAGDQNGIAQVVRQYFHTPAGYEAALVLAQMEADRGHRLAAAQLYRELLDTPQAEALFEPQLSLLAATNYLAAGQADLAAAIIRALAKRYPRARVRLAGHDESIPGADVDPVSWLSRLVGTPSRPGRDESNWLTLRGNPARNAQSTGGAPHLRVRWEARVINDPGVEAYLTSRGDQLTQYGGLAIPGARPIAVGNVVLMRTPYNLVAIDWYTGKRVWESREEDELDGDSITARDRDDADADETFVVGTPLEQRVWDDALVTSLASDGERAFVIRAPLGAAQDDVMAGQVVIGGWQTIRVPPAANELVAYDLATQGKLLWELDGTRSAGPLAGAFFFGAPLTIDNTLYVMAEVRSAVYLIALEPRTGGVRWQQQLVRLEQGIGLDPGRRLVGAMPSYADGILICPTSAGAAVAIDVVKREFAWVYRYPRELSTPMDMRQLLQQQQQGPIMRSSTNRWRDNLAIVDAGRVFLTPPESGELYCLDLHNGRLLWKYRKGDALFLACVDQGRALLVAKDSVRALRVEDGTPVWSDAIPLPEGATPTGQGYLSDGRYYLPVSTGGLVAIDLASGEIDASLAGPQHPRLGNLICYRGGVISQTALVLDKYEQRDVLRGRAEAALAKNSDDATALRELAEMRRAEGKTAEAVGQLKRAAEIAPNDPATQEMLAEVLLEALASDFAGYRHELPLVQKLLRGRDQEIELLRIEADGLDKLGERLTALDAFLRLVDFTAESPAELRIDPGVTVRSDRWVCGRLKDLWESASADERQTMEERIAARRPASTGHATAAELRHYLAHFGALPGAEALRRQLAQWLVERQHVREAEVALLALLSSKDWESQAAATALMTQLLSQGRMFAEAAAFATRLAGPLKDVQTLDGLTGSQWLQRLARKSPAALDPQSASWPGGRWQAAVKMLPDSGDERSNQQVQRQERQLGLRRLNMEQDSWPGFNTTQWFVSGDCTELFGRNGAGDDIFQLAVDENNWARQSRDNSFIHAARMGHLVVVSLGGQIVAVDSREADRDAGGEVLWKAYPAGRFPLNSARGLPRTGRRAVVFDTWSGRRRNPGTAAPIVGSLGPVTPQGVVFQEQSELKCVDPLSGEVLWMRNDLPPGCELFGDGELLIAANVAERTAQAFRMVDGERLGDRQLPSFPWMLTAGRNVAQRGIRGSGKDRTMYLRVTDVESQKLLLEAEYDDQAQMTVVEPHFVAVYEPSGRFQLVDARTGHVQIEAQLEPMPELQSIRTLLLGNELYVMVSSPSLSKENLSIAQPDYPLVNGCVYAYDIEKGQPLWPAAAVVRNRGIVLAQPSEVPLLMFLDRKVTRSTNTGVGGSQIRLLCLDRATGQTVYRNDEMKVSSITRLRVRTERQGPPTVIVEMNGAEVRLVATDQPRSPQPPANDDLEMPRASMERGLMEVGRRMMGAVQEALERQPAGGRARGDANNRKAENNQPPAAEPMDDD